MNSLWIAIGAVAVGSFLLKGAGPALLGERDLPAWSAGVLAFLAPTLLAALVVVDKLEATEKKTKATVALLKRLGATGKTLVIDVTPQDDFTLTARNIAGLSVVASSRVTARDVMDTTRVIATRDAIEKLQESLG